VGLHAWDGFRCRPESKASAAHSPMKTRRESLPAVAPAEIHGSPLRIQAARLARVDGRDDAMESSAAGG